ncbi:V-type proton ATPase 16 kDa proteolipid subunit 3 [Dictyocoela muelleri]|nr:V-type proton ATPase 16 kDa proteolipid subunit 3 [Dictyocoela muelleri]
MADNDELIIGIVKFIGYTLLTALPFAGSSFGMSQATKGICEAAEIRIEIASLIIPSCFITAPIIFSLIIMMVTPKDAFETVEKAMTTCAKFAISGFSGFFTGYGCGNVASAAVVTKAKQKKFAMQMVLLLIFVEFIALFGLIVSMIMAIKYGV